MTRGASGMLKLMTQKILITLTWLTMLSYWIV